MRFLNYVQYLLSMVFMYALLNTDFQASLLAEESSEDLFHNLITTDIVCHEEAMSSQVFAAKCAAIYKGITEVSISGDQLTCDEGGQGSCDSLTGGCHVTRPFLHINNVDLTEVQFKPVQSPNYIAHRENRLANFSLRCRQGDCCRKMNALKDFANNGGELKIKLAIKQFYVQSAINYKTTTVRPYRCHSEIKTLGAGLFFGSGQFSSIDEEVVHLTGGDLAPYSVWKVALLSANSNDQALSICNQLSPESGEIDFRLQNPIEGPVYQNWNP